ncbi:MAG: shikimate dehydrogenase [Candidatus Omnitrophica bacterium]|nr:shikimate dehydrogenase [Candidatus Omnitrophota bacterium]MDD5500494.1 shikimate dehydrogenase [Candidatus Omnitrophota bacterium]
MTSGSKLYGLIGFPVKHSLSPRMHNAAFAKLKIKAQYKLFELKPGQVEGFFHSLKNKGPVAFNVTIPYKEKVLPYLNFKSSGVRGIGAANTVVAVRGKLKGFNTDFAGFMAHLKLLGVKPRKAALIGAGGAARAVCFALGKMGAKEVRIYDIDPRKSLNLAERFKGMFGKTKFLSVSGIDGLGLAAIDLLVNASPVGMRRQDACLVRSDQMHPGIFVYDLIYNPAQTRLLKEAKKAGARCSNGLGMLLYQGTLSFEHFTGRKAPVDAMKSALMKAARNAG